MASKKKTAATQNTTARKKKATPKATRLDSGTKVPKGVPKAALAAVAARADALPSEVAEQNPTATPVAQLAAHAVRTAKLALPVRKALMSIKTFEVVHLDALIPGATLLADREGVWASVRARSRAGVAPDRVKKAEALRADMTESCRYVLRDTPEVQEELDQIQDGSGVADLALDLTRLAGLFERHKAALANDEDPAPEKVAAEARALGDSLGAGISPEGAAETQALRNRSYHLLNDDLSEVLEALRHLWRKSPTKLAQLGVRYASQLRRDQRARTRNKKKKPV